MNNLLKGFPITSVSRADVAQSLYSRYEGSDNEITVQKAEELALTLTDDKMIELAEKMADAYTGSDTFWIDLRILVEDLIEINN